MAAHAEAATARRSQAGQAASVAATVAPRRAHLDPGLLLLGWAGLSWGIAHVNGYFAPLAISLVLAGCLACLVACLGLYPPSRRVLLGGLAAVLVLEAATPWVHLQVRHPYAGGAAYAVATVLAGLATTGVAVLLARLLRGSRRGTAPRTPLPVLLALAAVALAADLAVVVAAPDPGIDVWTLLQASAAGLQHGADLYHQTWPHSTGLTDVYPYLPGSTLLTWPAWLLVGDVRGADLLALGAAGFLLLRLSSSSHRPGPSGDPLLGLVLPVLPLLLLAYPRALLVPQDAYTEPLLLALLLGMMLAVPRGKTGLAVVLFALALATKQHMALLVPVAALWPAFGLRRTLGSIGLALLIVAPWFLADPAACWHDAVTSTLAFPVLPTALDLPALLDRAGVTAGFWLAGLALLGAYAVVLRRLPRTVAGFSAGCLLVLLALDVTNKQTFFNHWTLVTGLVVVTVVLTAHEEAA